eukprot:TRINITY_DN9300_c0_g1_i3.p1 TRINITY_DN9300_c0_g1~~TRINITY_DN9300_c0_g1_i3.p1  ORF type:complete len:140 (+),score=17.21 TRINITY_DN9300_c0_g1_i3:94-513(+)
MLLTFIATVLLATFWCINSHGSTHDECDANPCGEQNCKDLYQNDDSRYDFVCICRSNENRKRVGAKVEDCMAGHIESSFDVKLGAPTLLSVVLIVAILIYSRISSKNKDEREKDEKYGAGSPSAEATAADADPNASHAG